MSVPTTFATFLGCPIPSWALLNLNLRGAGKPRGIFRLGGESAFRAFMAAARAKGWYPVIYGDGLCWVTPQMNTHYDGMPYFHVHGGDEVAVVNWDGKFFELDWPWRKNYWACVAAEKGRAMVLE